MLGEIRKSVSLKHHFCIKTICSPEFFDPEKQKRHTRQVQRFCEAGKTGLLNL
jgi:hypothetical protein